MQYAAMIHARNYFKLQRQQKIATRRITGSRNHKVFTEITAATLLMGMLLLSVAYASSTAIVSLQSSGTIRTPSAISGSLSVAGNRILTADGTPIVLKGMCYTYFVANEYAYRGDWMMPDGSIGWNTWSPTGVRNLLDFIQASNANVVRVFMTVEYWLKDTETFQNRIKYFVVEAANRGIYTDLTFWNANGTGQMPQDILPWQDGNGIISSIADFVNLWGNIGGAFKDYPSIIFELWNEPTGDQELWFNVAQQCIDRIRSVGATQPILIQWNYQINHDFGSGWHEGMDWVIENPLNDPTGNLIYSTHIYSSTWYGFYDSTLGATVTDYESINHALSDCRVYDVAAVHPVFIGEIGCSNWDLATQLVYFNNTLTLLDQHGVGYAAFAAPPWTSATQWGLVQIGVANYTLYNPGEILINHLGGTDYKDWISARG
jgi:hypothetical protein